MKWSQFKEVQPINEDPVSFVNHQAQRNAFKTFLQQRQVNVQIPSKDVVPF